MCQGRKFEGEVTRAGPQGNKGFVYFQHLRPPLSSLLSMENYHESRGPRLEKVGSRG